MKWVLFFVIGFALAQEKTGEKNLSNTNSPPSEESTLEENDGEVGLLGDWVDLEMPYQKQNVMVPKELWRVIKDILESDGVDEEIIDTYAVYPATMTIELMQHDVSVTKKNKNYRITFPEGGGDIDLFDYVDGRGKFYIRLSPHILNEENFHMLYVSHSPGRVIGDIKWGNGCGNIYDLSENSSRLVADQGLMVTTSKRHYLHLMAGLYVVFQLVEDRMLLGYIRIKDTRYPQFTCSI